MTTVRVVTDEPSSDDDNDAERIVIWYAQGIVMSQVQCTAVEARLLMVELSRQQGVPVSSVACDVVQRSLSRPLENALSIGSNRGTTGDD
jgi:AmiR/NasT family two-component response regulator